MAINILNVIFTGVFLLAAVYLWLRASRLKSSTTSASAALSVSSEQTAKDVLIQISVPKNNDKTPLAAEQLFAALHGIYRDDTETQARVSCEIVSKDKLINFYLYAPAQLKDFVLSQVYAQYPNVDVKVLTLDQDYAQVENSKKVVVAELTLKKPAVYPLKTFQNFEVDPLATITGVLSSTGALEEIWTQLIISPLADDWQDKGDEEIKNIKEPPKKSKGFAELATTEAKTFAVQFAKSVVTGNGIEEKKDEKKEDKKELSGPVQQAIKGIEDKITKLGFATTIRIVVAAPDEFAAQAKLEQVIGSYKQFNTNNLNSFVSKPLADESQATELYRSRDIGTPEMIFNITELASIYHFPSETVSTPTIAWSGAKKGEPPSNLPVVGSVPEDELTVFAQTNFRNEQQKFGIKRADRRLHSYIIGKTGTGKSTLMENMIYNDIQAGRGLAVVDPHGELIEHVLDLIPEHRVKDVVYFNPADYDYPVGFNVLENVDPEMKNIVASGVVGIFEKIFGEVSWGPRLEYILRNVILALLEYPNSTLLGVMRILTDTAYRRSVLNTIKDPVVRGFFIDEFEKYEPKFRQEAIAPIQNKVGQFTSSSTIRNIIGQPRSSMDIREIMDSGKILLANLSTGKIGEDNSALLGSMLITKIQLAAMGRTDIKEDERRDFYLYVDEFQNFATDSFATILSEARKYRLNLVMINQYINQMPETVAHAVFGNVGTMIAFRVGAADAEALKDEFQPVFDVNDLVNQPNRQIYLKMAIDGVTVPAFSAATLPPPAEKYNLHEDVIEESRAMYATPRTDVEEYIADWSEPVNLTESWKQEKEIKKQESGQTVTPTTTVPAGVGTEPITTVNNQQNQPNLAASATPTTKVGESSQTKKLEQEAELLKDLKVEMVNDRFNRKWYSVTGVVKIPAPQPAPVEKTEDVKIEAESDKEIGESGQENQEALLVEHPAFLELGELGKDEISVSPERQLPAPVQSGGEGERIEEKNILITWEDADQLGLKLPENIVSRPVVKSDGFEPIDEL